jgi:hypothetical protein
VHQEHYQSEQTRETSPPTSCQNIEADAKCSTESHQHQRVDSTEASNHDQDDELSPKARRKQLRELMAASADCWDDNLSDDDSPTKLPLEWQADMVRREMNKKRRDPPGAGGAPDISSNNDALFPDEEYPTNNNPEYQMSLPEQLLRNRLARKQRLQKKTTL